MNKFSFNNFICDVDVYRNDSDLVVKFYNQLKEQKPDQMVNLVIVDPGYGYISLKYIGENAILSGLLDETIFSSNEIIESAIDFVESLSSKSINVYIPHHIRRVKLTSYVEYNGEY